MKTKHIMLSLLIMLILLTACSAESSSNYWENWIKNVPKGEFEQADSESFIFEQNGYSVEVTIEKWLVARASSEYVLHPASNEIPMPLLQSSDGVIPFVLTAKTVTNDSSFVTDYHLSAYATVYDTEYDSYASHSFYLSYACGLSQFEVTVEDLTERFDSMKPHIDEGYIQEIMPQWHSQMWPTAFSGNFSETKFGDEQVVLGCYVLKNYYSPEFPDGNFEVFPSDSAVLRILMRADTTQREEQFNIVVLH